MAQSTVDLRQDVPPNVGFWDQAILRGATSAAPRESAPVQVLERLHDGPYDTRRRLASEKRQGTKSREVGQSLAAHSLYGDSGRMERYFGALDDRGEGDRGPLQRGSAGQHAEVDVPEAAVGTEIAGSAYCRRAPSLPASDQHSWSSVMSVEISARLMRCRS